MNETHHEHDVADQTGGDPHGQAYWDARYGSRERIWSGEPNRQLVAEAAPLKPGRALEVGCGEGADALWLAGRGWRVTAVDVSEVALARAAARAEELGDEVAGRVAWKQADAREWAPPSAAYELVSAQYLHFPPDVRPQVVRRLAGAVAPGGVLLYVGHDPSDHDVVSHPHPELLPAAAEIGRLLDGEAWDVEVAEARARPATHRGRELTLHDAVLRARRRG